MGETQYDPSPIACLEGGMGPGSVELRWKESGKRQDICGPCPALGPLLPVTAPAIEMIEAFQGPSYGLFLNGPAEVLMFSTTF